MKNNKHNYKNNFYAIVVISDSQFTYLSSSEIYVFSFVKPNKSTKQKIQKNEMEGKRNSIGLEQ